MDKKRCSKCKELKPLSDFYKDKSKKSGYKSQCKTCLNTEEKREYLKEYRKNHKDYFREKHSEFRARNREKLREISKNNRLNNPERYTNYYLINRDKILEKCRLYNHSEHGRAVRKLYKCTERYKINKTNNRMERRSKGRTGDNDITLEKLYNLSDGVCALCGKRCDYEDYIFKGTTFVAGNNYPSIDHIKPISKGGTHTWDNVQLAHRLCNSIKSDKGGF